MQFHWTGFLGTVYQKSVLRQFKVFDELLSQPDAEKACFLFFDQLRIMIVHVENLIRTTGGLVRCFLKK